MARLAGGRGSSDGCRSSSHSVFLAQLSSAIRVLLVDTGIASDAKVSVHSEKNVLDPTLKTASDDNGHGTAIALVIDDLAPGTEFIVFKAGNSNGDVNEWDLLAALVADAGADVINLSVEYGLGDRTCPTCGRQSSSSRSAVFENILNATAKWNKRPVVVAAAGNGRAPDLAYPATFRRCYCRRISQRFHGTSVREQLRRYRSHRKST